MYIHMFKQKDIDLRFIDHNKPNRDIHQTSFGATTRSGFKA